MKTVREGPVIILPRNDGKGTVDVFTGHAWEKHTVFEVTEGKIKFVKGVAIKNDEFKVFKASL